ncbi:MAG: hypothetical protein ACOYU3_08610 [Bacillota bacterium]
MQKLFAAVVAVVFLTASVALAAPANTYTIPELNMTVEIPDGWAVFTRDVKADDPNLSLLGMDAESVKKTFLEDEIYLSAIKMEPYSEIAIVMMEDDAVKYIDMGLYADDTLDVMAKMMMKNPNELTYTGYTIYKNEKTKFLCLDFLCNDGSNDYGRQYYTIKNGQAMFITLYSYEGKVSSGQEKIVKDVVDSIVFTEAEHSAAPSQTIYSNAPSKTVLPTLDGSLLTALLFVTGGVVVAGVAILIIYIVKRKKHF